MNTALGRIEGKDIVIEARFSHSHRVTASIWRLS